MYLVSTTPVRTYPLRLNPLRHPLLNFSPQSHYSFSAPVFFAWVVHSMTFIPDLGVTQLRFSKRVSPGLIQKPIQCKSEVKYLELSVVPQDVMSQSYLSIFPLGLLLNPLKTPESLWFSDFFSGRKISDIKWVITEYFQYFNTFHKD